MPLLSKFSQTRSEIPAPYSYRIGRLAGFLFFCMAAFRKLEDLHGYPAFTAAMILLAAFLLLYITEPVLFRWFPKHRPLYFLLQAGLIQSLGLLHPYEDTWASLYIPLSLCIWYYLPPRRAAAWSALFAACLSAAMLLTFGGLQGLGYALTYISACAVFIAYGYQVAQTEIAQAESQRLLAKLQEAHERLEEYSARAERLASAQERDRLARELHDSVSQTIFSITLHTQAVRLMLEKEPGRVPEQLDRLQELTGQALGRMRALIGQWRPG